MNLLQGFNVVDGNSLKEDFDALAIDAGALGAIKVLGEHIAAINKVTLLAPYAGESLEPLFEALRPLHGFVDTGSGMIVSGAKILRPEDNALVAELDPVGIADVLAPLAPTFGETSMGDLIDLLFERGVLKYRDY
jgi:hypothetical protein